jgi:hypothetical protein
VTAAGFRYEREAAATVDRLHAEASDSLWAKLCEAVDTIVDRPTSREARAQELRGRDGKAVWKLDLFDADEHWAVLWHHDADGFVVIAWVGEWPPSR